MYQKVETFLSNFIGVGKGGWKMNLSGYGWRKNEYCGRWHY